jgi:hypothetical protein
VSSTVPDAKTARGQAGDLLREHRQHIARVRDDDERGVGGDVEQLRHHRLEDVGVDAGQLDARLARLLLRARGDHDDVRALRDRDVGAADDVARPGELGAVGEIEHLGLGLLGGDVVEGDVARGPRMRAA